MSSVARGLQQIFVGNLPWTVGQRELKQYFSRFGHVSAASVIFDRATGMSRGYGFVTFSTRDGFNSASNKMTHLLDGRLLSVQPSNQQ